VVEVNIEVTIDLKEAAVWESITGARNYEQMIHSHTAPCGSIYRMNQLPRDRPNQRQLLNDAYVEEMYRKSRLPTSRIRRRPTRLHKELMKYVLEQAWVIRPRCRHCGISGGRGLRISTVNLAQAMITASNFTYFSWINRDLKESNNRQKIKTIRR